MTPIPNIWHQRTTAESDANACLVCYKPSCTVLITPDSKDYFYICLSHLRDRGFCEPVIDREAETKRAEETRKKALEEEIERVKEEYKEKMERRKEREMKGKEKEKDPEEKEKEKQAEQKKDKQERDDKIKSLEDKANPQEPEKKDSGPRIFALHRTFYNKRIERLRGIEISRRNFQRLQEPGALPSVPKTDPK